MGGMYFLKTKRLEFSKWTPLDLALARRLWGNEQVTRWICAGGRFDEDEIAARLAQETENDKEYGVQYWPLFECASGEFVGCCGLRAHGKKPESMSWGSSASRVLGTRLCRGSCAGRDCVCVFDAECRFSVCGPSPGK